MGGRVDDMRGKGWQGWLREVGEERWDGWAAGWVKDATRTVWGEI